MRAVVKTIRFLILALLGAAIIHIAIILLIPRYTNQTAWSGLGEMKTDNRFQQINSSSLASTDNDPFFIKTACRFNLKDAPVHISGPSDGLPFWSLSIYNRQGDNLFSVNDSVNPNKDISIIITQPQTSALIKAKLDQVSSQTIVLEQDINEGIIMLQAYMPDESWRRSVSNFIQNLSCQPLDILG